MSDAALRKSTRISAVGKCRRIVLTFRPGVCSTCIYRRSPGSGGSVRSDHSDICDFGTRRYSGEEENSPLDNPDFDLRRRGFGGSFFGCTDGKNSEQLGVPCLHVEEYQRVVDAFQSGSLSPARLTAHQASYRCTSARNSPRRVSSEFWSRAM